ncbi:MAG: universal stress protein [Helicobacteraceae bacterium]|nr:universal stress protein [Helicobacteraceae bacterium]
MKSIVVERDLSPQSDVVVRKAAAVAKGAKAKLILVSAANEQGFFERIFNSKEERPTIDERKLALLETLKSLGVEGEAIVQDEPLCDLLARAAKENAADLIALDDRAASELDGFFLSDTTKCVIDRSDSPILAIKNDDVAAYSRILIATDFQQSSLNAALFALKTFPDAEFLLFNAYFTPSDVIAAHNVVTDGISAMLDTMKREATAKLDEFKSALPPTKNEIRAISRASASPSDSIANIALSEKSDLIVVGAGEIGTLLSDAIGDSTESLLKRSAIDILVVR